MGRNSRIESPSSDPPKILEHHVRVPDQLSKILNAQAAHARGLRGQGIRVAIIDSGFYPHPFYESRGYRISRIPTRREPFPEVDEYGHGTAQLASLFAIAPDAEALAIKCLDRDPSYSLRKALQLKPDVLVCAWGFNLDRPGTRKLPAEYEPMRRLIQRAHGNGICVVAAAGNGQFAFPGCMPEVISAGGVYYTADGKFSLSDVASRFRSSVYPGREVPDVCGLVGNLPYGRLLLVPVPPRARLAKRPAFSMIAAGEPSELTESLGSPSRRSDWAGWAMFSGTSAAAAMVAGAAALLLQKSREAQNPAISPEEIKRRLVLSSRSVEGTSCGLLDVESALTGV